MEKLVLIDGNSLINRAFYAMPVLTTKNGTFTNAVYGFMNMFIKMLMDEKPTAVAVAFDLKAPTFRHKLFSDYKGTRKPMPEELRPQIPLLKEVLSLMGITVLQQEGIEADDIIGTVAKHTDIPTIIITGDKDSFQLVDEQTEVHFTKRGLSDVEIYTHKNFLDKTGINPIQIIDLKAFMGDASDNIPGIPGIGEKTAISFVQTYGSVDGLYANLDSLKGKLKEKVEQGKDSAYLSKTLATINVDCDVETNPDKMRVSFPFSQDVRKKFIELEFKSLYKRDDLFLDSDLSSHTPVEESSQSIPVQTVIVSDLKLVSNLSFTDGTTFYLGKNMVSIFFNATEYIIPIRETLLDDGFSLGDAIGALSKLFTSNERIIVFNKKELKHLLTKLDLAFSAPCDDLSLIKYLVEFSGKDESADEVIEAYGYELTHPAQALKKIFDELYEKLIAEEVLELYQKVELPLSDVLYQMEIDGFMIDANALYSAGVKYEQKLSNLTEQIRTLADQPTLNVNSPKQLGQILFEKLNLGKGKKNKHGYSTTAEVLESIEDQHPIVPLVLKFRQAQKLFSTYIEGFKPLIEKDTGLIHTSFNQTVTATGRLSSKEPNLQNIPVRDEEGKELRKFFVPRDDNHLLVGADYSQIELRLLAAFSKCQSLIDAFNSGADIHSATASKVFKVDKKDVSPTMRSRAKAVNFGIIYGMSEYGLAKTLKISAQEARAYINAYFDEYPEVKAYMNDNVQFAKDNGYSKTLLGRKRYIRELASSNYMTRQFGERVAMNMPLQGSSADVIKLAMLGVSKRLKDENLESKLILQVHDELIIDTLKSEKERVEKILVEEMEGAVKLAVPLTVELGSGENWFDAK